jgi:16S rRNA (adenine1518-N6/adenine1519-N6)-dimethyltransferase
MSEQNDPELTQAPARKALGQHFLFDPSILHRAATAAGPLEGRTVIEVGPGPGGLTRAILKEGAAKLIAVETDPRFASALQEWPETQDARLTVIEKDARKVKWEKVLQELDAETPAMIIANLPYNVGTILLIDWLKAGTWRGEMALMFQKEVAQRICADPGTEHYGRLAVLAGRTGRRSSPSSRRQRSPARTSPCCRPGRRLRHRPAGSSSSRTPGPRASPSTSLAGLAVAIS